MVAQAESEPLCNTPLWTEQITTTSSTYCHADTKLNAISHFTGTHMEKT